MGSGVAKQIRAKYPEVYADYVDKCNKLNTSSVLGDSQFVQCNDGRTVVNMFAQSGYGYDGGLYTDYSAFQSCLQKIKETVHVGEAIAMPYKIGCGLGGGNWKTICELIETTLGEEYKVELWRLRQ